MNGSRTATYGVARTLSAQNRIKSVCVNIPDRVGCSPDLVPSRIRWRSWLNRIIASSADSDG